MALPPPPSHPPCPAPPPPPPNPRHGDGPPPPPPARGSGRERITYMTGRYAESSGKPSHAPQAACEPQDRPSNQIKSNPISTPSPPHLHPISTTSPPHHHPTTTTPAPHLHHISTDASVCVCARACVGLCVFVWRPTQIAIRETPWQRGSEEQGTPGFLLIRRSPGGKPQDRCPGPSAAFLDQTASAGLYCPAFGLILNKRAKPPLGRAAMQIEYHRQPPV